MSMLKNLVISALDDIYYAIYTRVCEYDGEYEDIYGRDESDPEGWTAEDEAAYRGYTL